MIKQENRSPGLVPAIAVLGALLLIAGHSRAIEMCLAPGGPDQWNVTVDCDPLNATVHPNAWLGFNEHAAPCSSYAWCLDGLDYQWGISSSDTDPYEWTGQLPRPSAELYLWVTCIGHFGGWDWALFAVQVTDAEIVSFEPRNGVQNLGTATDLHLVAPGGCSDAEPLLAGKWTLETPVTTAPETWGATWGRVKTLYR